MGSQNVTRRVLLGAGSGLLASTAAPGAHAVSTYTGVPGHELAGMDRSDLAVGAPLWVGAGQFDRVFDPSTQGRRSYFNDHTLIRGRDGTWHFFGIVGDRVAPGEVPDSAREASFAHATSPRLDGPWTLREDVLSVDPRYFGEEHLWAPHVVESGGRYFMFYAAGGQAGAAINLATSDDLFIWTRHPSGPLFRGVVARDPMILRHGDRWIMYYTEVDASTRRHLVAYRTSTDLLHWSPASNAFVDQTTEATVSITESPFVVERDGWFHLFIGPRNGYVGTDVFRSTSPFAFALNDLAGHVPGHAVEVVTEDGIDYATAAGWFQRGLLRAPIQWSTSPTPWQSPDNPAVMLGAGGQLNAFALSSNDRSLLRSVQVDPRTDTWTDWQPFGGPAGAVPTLGRNADGRLEVFSLAPGGQALDHRVQRADGQWEAWERFGGPAGAAPAVNRNAGGRLEVLALGPGGLNIARRRQVTAGSRQWEAWDGAFAGRAGSPPVLGRNADGRLEAFMTTPGGSSILHRWQNRADAPGDAWSTWQHFGDAAGGAPRVGRDGTGRQSVVAIAPSGTGSFLRQQLTPSGSWQDWRWHFPWSHAAPSLAANQDGRLEAFSSSPGGERVLHRWQTTPGGGWHAGGDFGEPGLVVTSTPISAVDEVGRIHVFVVTEQGRVRRRVQAAPNGNWRPWTSFGTLTVAVLPSGSPT